MHGVDKNLFEKDKRKNKRLEEENNRTAKFIAEAELGPMDANETEAEDVEVCHVMDFRNVSDNENIPQIQSRGTIHFIDDRMLASMDKCKLSTRQAMHIVTATAAAILDKLKEVSTASTAINVKDLVLNRTTINSMRKEYRRRQAKRIIDEFNIPQVFVLHWDGKLLPDIKGIEKQERLSLVVTSENMEKLLGIPKIENSSGENIAEATLKFLRHWALDGLVEIISFDNTGTNTGVNNGAAYLLEKKLGRKLLFLPCRHHISELLVRAVFELNYGKTSGPEVLLFNRFAKYWKNIESSNFTKGTLDEEVLRNLSSSQLEYLKNFCLNALKCHYVRADYKELLQLTLHFIGEHVPHFTEFRLPGATSHARFMSKCIYCLKMFLFRNQFKMTAAELKSLRSICLFLIIIYVPYWFRSVNAIEAPQLDLDVIQKIIPYFDKAISTTLLQKLRNHLWYLAEETVGLSFFDEIVPLEIKKKMVQKLGIDNEDEDEIFSYSERDISHFVSSRTKIFFTRLSIDVSFLQVDPSEWSQRDDYCGGKRVCQHLNVVNDAAERAIKLITDFNRSLTYDEEDKQFLLKVVEHYRKLYPSHNKFALIS